MEGVFMSGFVQEENFRNFLSEINDCFWNPKDKESAEELYNKIQKCWEAGEISDSQYDKLIRELDELCGCC